MYAATTIALRECAGAVRARGCGGQEERGRKRDAADHDDQPSELCCSAPGMKKYARDLGLSRSVFRRLETLNWR